MKFYPADAREALSSLQELYRDEERDGILIGDRWYPRWRLEEIAQKYREPAERTEHD